MPLLPRRLPAFLALLIVCGAAHAFDLAGNRKAVLHGNSGEQVVLGQVRLTAAGDSAYSFEFTPNRGVFEERFLAMRPFLCIDDPARSLCHFPYKNPHHVTAGDLTDLEYQFLFLQKPRASVITDRGIEGRLKEGDMTPIIVPEGDMTRPIKREDLFPVDLAQKWLPRLTTE